MPVRETADFIEKRLSSRERGEPEAIARFRSEAALLERLALAGVVPVPALVGRGEDEGGPWHRLERIPLPTVEEIVAFGGARDAVWVESATRAAFDALARLHEAADEAGPLGVVHADLSPSNLAIDREHGTRAVILDFDLAVWRDGPPRDGAFRGTAFYTAPEIARGETPTVQSDLFCLAAVLLYAALGRPPRERPRGAPEAASFAALLMAAAESPILDGIADHGALAERGPGHAAIFSCLAHDAAERPASARAALALCADANEAC